MELSKDYLFFLMRRNKYYIPTAAYNQIKAQILRGDLRGAERGISSVLTKRRKEAR